MALNLAYPLTFDISDFSLGWDNINSPTTLDKRTFKDIKNFNLTRRRGLEKRGGISTLYDDPETQETAINSLYEYKAPDGNNYVLTASGTTIAAFYNAQWNDLITGLTTGKKYSFETHRGLCYGVNGLDDNFKLRNTTSHIVGIAPPLGAPKVSKGDPPETESLYTNHGIANIDYIGEFRQNASRTMIAQSFILDEDYELTKVVLKIREVGAPTGKMRVEIHSNQEGTMVSGGDSDGVTVDAIGSTFADTDFDFSGTKPSLSKNTTYYIVIKDDGTMSDVSDTNFIEVGFDWNNGYAQGEYYEIDGSNAWTLFSGADLGFEIHAVQTTGTEQVSFGAVNTGHSTPIRQDNQVYLLAQSFVPNADSDITSVKLALKKNSVLTLRNYWVEIHSRQTGTSATKRSSTWIVGHESNEVNGGDISFDASWIEFTFSGTKPSLSVVATTVDQNSVVDGIKLYVAATTGFVVGGTVVVGSGTAREENKVIESISSGDYLTLTEKLEYTHTAAQADAVENTYYIVIYVDDPVNTTKYASWVRDESGYSDGQRHWINNSLAWTDLTYDYSFKVYGYATAGAKVEEHSLADIVQIRDLRETENQEMIAQSFTVDESGDCSKVRVRMSEIETPANGTPTVWAEIHSAQDGVSASKRGSTHIVGQESTAVNTSTLSDFPDFGWVTFTFGGTKPNLNAGSTYYLVIYGDFAVSTTNFVGIALDKTPPGYSGGTRWDIDVSDSVPYTEIPGQDMIFEIYMTTAGLGATYYYCYTYKRTDWLEIEGNPSDISDSITPSTQDVDVGVVASTDSQVDKIILYRTLANETTPFYKQGEYANTTATISDSVADNGLTTLWDETNTVPPKATFIKLHGDRIFYANCPDEDEGSSLVMWSKSGNGEVVPSANYQYFDKDDGEEITGVASLGTYFFVFKPNKIGVLDIASPEIWYLSYGIGCIAPWATLTFKDKIVFLSEEGWKATDGTDIWDLSDNISGLIDDGYMTINEKENYSVAYYPEKEHFEFLISHSTEDPMVVVGHFLVPLILKPTGISELVKQNIMGWTYHEYDYHALTCIGNYTDSNGITRVIAGADNGFIYLLDSGTDDDGENITTKLRTDWLSLGIPRSITKTIRKGYLTYGTSGTISLGLTVDIDFTATDETTTLTGGDVDIEDSINESFPLTGTGELFRFTLLETSTKSLDLMGLVVQFRSEGVR